MSKLNDKSRRRVSENVESDENEQLLPGKSPKTTKRHTLLVDEHDSNRQKQKQKQKRHSKVSFSDDTKKNQSKIPVRQTQNGGNKTPRPSIIKNPGTFTTKVQIESSPENSEKSPCLIADNPDSPKTPSPKTGERPFSPETECEYIMDEESPPTKIKHYQENSDNESGGFGRSEDDPVESPDYEDIVGSGNILKNSRRSSDDSLSGSYTPNYSPEPDFGPDFHNGNMPNFIENNMPRARRIAQQKPVQGGVLCWPPPQIDDLNTMNTDFEKPSPTSSTLQSSNSNSPNNNKFYSNSRSTLPVNLTTTTTKSSSNETDSINQMKHLQRCCCGCVKVTTGCIIIAVLECIYLLIQLTDTVYLMASTDRGNPVYLTIAFTMILLVGVAIFLLFVGIRSNRHQLLVPHILMQLLVLLLLVAIVAYLIMTVLGGTAIGLRVVTSNGRNLPAAPVYPENQQALQAAGPLIQASRTPAVVFAQRPIPAAQMVTPALKLFLLMCAVLAALLALLQIWLTSTVYQCYRYIRLVNMADLKLQDTSLSSSSAYSANPVVTTIIDEHGRRNSLC